MAEGAGYHLTAGREEKEGENHALYTASDRPVQSGLPVLLRQKRNQRHDAGNRTPGGGSGFGRRPSRDRFLRRGTAVLQRCDRGNGGIRGGEAEAGRRLFPLQNHHQRYPCWTRHFWTTPAGTRFLSLCPTTDWHRMPAGWTMPVTVQRKHWNRL